MHIYQKHGYETRLKYLYSLSEDFDVSIDVVMQLANLLGETEDFDGLISSLEDYVEEEGY
jgi:hypothetical protein